MAKGLGTGKRWLLKREEAVTTKQFSTSVYSLASLLSCYLYNLMAGESFRITKAIFEQPLWFPLRGS